MTMMNRMRMSVAVVLLSFFLVVGVNCDNDFASALVEVSAEGLGSVVSVVAAEYLETALDIQADEEDNGDENRPLHDYEH